MARPKTIQQAGENLRQVAPLIGARYITGINNADWQGPASSEQAEQNYSTGVRHCWFETSSIPARRVPSATARCTPVE